MYGYIYLTTNLVNGTQYIGRHKSSVFEFDKYIGSGTILAKAIEKYGKENFKCVLLESVNGVPTICESEEELNNSENYYTKLYNCVQSDNFYNLVEGGTSGSQVYDSLTEEQKKQRNKTIGDKSSNWWNTVSDDQVQARTDKWRATYFDKSVEELEERSRKNSDAQKRFNANLSLEERLELNVKLKQGAQNRLNNPETERVRKEKEAQTKAKHTPEQRAEYKRKQQAQQVGRHYYTDGVIKIKCKPEDVPEGFIQCKGHNNNASYICIIDGIEFLGLNGPTDYLKHKGYNSINGDKILRLAKGDSELLNKRFPDLVGKIQILDKKTQEIIYG